MMVVAYLKDGPAGGGGAAEGLKQGIEARPGVKKAEYVSKESALSTLKAGLKGHEGLLEGVPAGILPASFEITLDPSYINPESVHPVVERLKAMDAVEDVEYGAEFVAKFSAFLRFMEVFTLAIGLFLASATVFIISNTIRLTVYARKDEIEVMRYLGESNLFIKIPFFMEGVTAGGLGGLISLAILELGRYVLGLYIPPSFVFVIENTFPFISLTGLVVLCGFFLGGVGSIVSMGRFLRV
ncbi:MAG: ABC transporter permease [Deltaproteobacteria bacterium]|nr:ABC transporter permease [Deltaproteobacteria bacterium]